MVVNRVCELLAFACLQGQHPLLVRRDGGRGVRELSRCLSLTERPRPAVFGAAAGPNGYFYWYYRRRRPDGPPSLPHRRRGGPGAAGAASRDVNMPTGWHTCTDAHMPTCIHAHMRTRSLLARHYSVTFLSTSRPLRWPLAPWDRGWQSAREQRRRRQKQQRAGAGPGALESTPLWHQHPEQQNPRHRRRRPRRCGSPRGGCGCRTGRLRSRSGPRIRGRRNGAAWAARVCCRARNRACLCMTHALRGSAARE